jgi:acetyl-CoA decarbonylase/synthase complex subunit delta
MELLRDKWTGKIAEVTIGSGDKAVTIGGETTMPFLLNEGQVPNRPRIAMEVWDVAPADWADSLKAALGDEISDPAAWAAKCASEFGAELIALRLMGAHAEYGDKPADEVARTIKTVLDATGLPLIIRGCGDDEKDNEILPVCSQAAKGANALLGMATQDSYKTLTASCLADGHAIITDSPIDINIAKQVNILVTDMGFDQSRIVMHPSTAALGYGMEYVYSIMERARIAALADDRMLAMPFVLFPGEECWRVKEAKGSNQEHPDWGDQQTRGPVWEETTAACMLQAGADLLVMRHPGAVANTRKLIDKLMEG